jgi:plastocyanin
MARRLAVSLATLVLLLVMTVGAASTAHAGGGGGCEGAVRTEARATQVVINRFCYAPAVVHVTPGQTVTWTNAEWVEHTVTGVARSFGDYESLAKDRSVSHRFDQAATFPYFCAFHPGMVGAVVVGGDGAPALQRAAAAKSVKGGGDSGWAAWAVGLAVAGAAAGAAGGWLLARRRVATR